MNKASNAKDKLVPDLKMAIQILDETKVQCREMLQLVDNLNAHMDTDERKAQHARQQEYWASNLVHVSQHLAAMQESINQIETGRLNPGSHIVKSIRTVIEQAKEFADHIGKVYWQIVHSIAPIERDIVREIEQEQKQH